MSRLPVARKREVVGLPPALDVTHLRSRKYGKGRVTLTVKRKSYATLQRDGVQMTVANGSKEIRVTGSKNDGVYTLQTISTHCELKKMYLKMCSRIGKLNREPSARKRPKRAVALGLSGKKQGAERCFAQCIANSTEPFINGLAIRLLADRRLQLFRNSQWLIQVKDKCCIEATASRVQFVENFSGVEMSTDLELRCCEVADLFWTATRRMKAHKIPLHIDLDLGMRTPKAEKKKVATPSTPRLTDEKRRSYMRPMTEPRKSGKKRKGRVARVRSCTRLTLEALEAHNLESGKRKSAGRRMADRSGDDDTLSSDCSSIHEMGSLGTGEVDVFFARRSSEEYSRIPCVKRRLWEQRLKCSDSSEELTEDELRCIKPYFLPPLARLTETQQTADDTTIADHLSFGYGADNNITIGSDATAFQLALRHATAKRREERCERIRTSLQTEYVFQNGLSVAMRHNDTDNVLIFNPETHSKVRIPLRSETAVRVDCGPLNLANIQKAMLALCKEFPK